MISISIIIPVYNIESYITRCLDSVENQDYMGNIECVIVDDCSNDDSLNIIKQFITSHGNSHIKYKLIDCKKNAGVSVARNKALEIATGEYVYFLDGDDYLHSNAISLLANQVELHTGIDMVMGTFDNNDDFTYRDLEIYKQKQYVDNPIWIQYAFLRWDGEFNITSTDKLTRRDFLIENKILFPAGIIIHEDNHWLYQVLDKIQTFAFVFEKTYIRYKHSESATHTINRKNERKNWHRIMCDYSRNIRKPLRKLKLGRFMHCYFYERLYELKMPKDFTIRLRFIIESLMCGEKKVATMLLLTLFFPKLCWKKNINIHIEVNAGRLFYDESMKYKDFFAK